MAASEAARRKPDAPARAVDLDGLVGVARTRGLEATHRPPAGRDPSLREANAREQCPRRETGARRVRGAVSSGHGPDPEPGPWRPAGAHSTPAARSAEPRSRRSASNGALAASGKAVTTISSRASGDLDGRVEWAGTGNSSSINARSRRRTRLRTTAPPTRLHTAYPTRVPPQCFGRTATASATRRARLPERRTAAKSARRRSRCAPRVPDNVCVAEVASVIATMVGSGAGRCASEIGAVAAAPRDRGGSDREARASALAAPTDDLAPASRCHAREEPVLAEAGDALRLPGSFHGMGLRLLARLDGSVSVSW